MLKINNQNLVSVLEFLQGVELQPKVSRVRTKICKMLQNKVDDLYKDEVELLEKYAKKDTLGKLIEHEGTFSLIEETAIEYHKEKTELLNEDSLINVDELQDKVQLLIDGLENGEGTVSGKNAEVLDIILDALEKSGINEKSM